MASSAKKRSKGSKACNGKRKRRNSGSDEDEPAFLSPKYAEPPTSKIYNSRFLHKDPAELFRKDLISAMKLPDNEPLTPDDYWLIEDSWKPEWERGVQVPVYPEALPESSVKSIRKKRNNNFKLHKKFIRFTRGKFYDSNVHFMSYTNTLAERTCRYDMDDVDLQWLTLVNEEREDFGLQPLEESKVEQIIDEFEVQSYVNFQEAIKSEEGLGVEYDEDAICDVCRSPDSQEGNEMVFCDSCNICVHQICYGITKIPEGSWICRTCALGIRPACVLCPNRGGAMKTTRCGQKWAHVGCAVWIPEVSFFNFAKMEPITKISFIPPSRWTLVCSICKGKNGACIQCSEKSCKTAFHVTCAFQQGLQMRASVKLSNTDDDTLQAFCQKHSGKRRTNLSDSDEDALLGGVTKKESLTSEERANIRQQKIQAKEAEFYNYVNIDEVADLFQYDRTDIEIIYNYWKLKRRANWNRALLPPKIDTDCDEENSPFAFLKKLVHHRQDLERARNLCYMVSKREKLVRNWIFLKEHTFLKQAEVLEKLSSDLSVKETEAVLNANVGNLAYDKKHTGLNGPSPNVVNVLTNLVGEDVVKTQVNGAMKSSRKSMKSERTPNPYAKHYLNGLMKRSQRWFASVDKKRKVSCFQSGLDGNLNANLSFQSSSEHVVSDDGFELLKDMHDINLDHKSLFMSQVDPKFECFNANDNAFVNLETYHSTDALLKENNIAEECESKKEICFPDIHTFCQSSNDSSFASPAKNLDESIADLEIKIGVKFEDNLNCTESKSSDLELSKQNFNLSKEELLSSRSKCRVLLKKHKILTKDIVEKVNIAVEGEDAIKIEEKVNISNESEGAIKMEEELNIPINVEDISSISHSEAVESSPENTESLLKQSVIPLAVRNDSENIKFSLDVPIENCVEVETEQKSDIVEIVNSIDTAVVIPDVTPKLEKIINILNDDKLNSAVQCVIIKSEIPLLPAKNEIVSIKLKSPQLSDGCDKSIKVEASESNNNEEIKVKLKSPSVDVPIKDKSDVKVRPSHKSSPLRTQSPISVKATENGAIKSKSSPRQNQEKSQIHSKSSAAKSKHITHPVVSSVNKQHTSLPLNKCQEKTSPVSKNDESESLEMKESKETSPPVAPVPRKDMLRGYKIPKKPRTEKPEENSLDLKRGNTPLSPLPDITSSTMSGYHTKTQTSWRKMEPRSVPSKPWTNMNGNIQHDLSERLVLKLKKDTSDPESERWKTDSNNFNRNNIGSWMGDFPPMHPRLLPPPPPPPFLHPPRQWPRMRSQGGYRQIHMGYGNGPYT